MSEKPFCVDIFLDTHDFDPNVSWRPASWLQTLQKLGTQQCDYLGYGEEWMAEQGFYWVLIRIKLKMDRNPDIGMIRGETWHPGISGALWRRDYQINTCEGERIGGAVALWAIIDREQRHLLRPNRFPKAFPVIADREALPGLPEKLPAEKLLALRKYRISYSDLDSNGHANNARYAEWICDTLPLALLRDHWVDSLQINFRQEVMLGQEIDICGQARSDDSRQWDFAAWSGEVLHFTARLSLRSLEIKE